jgi:hypothetical protein
MPRPAKLLSAQVLGVRLPGELIERLDIEVARRQEEHPGVLLTRADLIREGVYLLLQGVPGAPKASTPRSRKASTKSAPRAKRAASTKAPRRSADPTLLGTPICLECGKPNKRNLKKTPYCSEACKRRALRRAKKI